MILEIEKMKGSNTGMKGKAVKKWIMFIALFVIMFSAAKMETRAAYAYPNLSMNAYLEMNAFRDINVYTGAGMSTRGTCSPWKKYNAYISKGDVVYVYTITSQFCYLSYPAGGTRKYAYCKTVDLLGSSQANVCFTAKAGCTVYRTPTGASYSSISKNDTVYTTIKKDNRGLVIYTAKSGNRAWKAGWINLNDITKIKNSSSSTATTYYVKTSGPGYSLIMRSAPYSISARVTTIPYASAVSVYSITNNWAKITYSGKSGYCNASYLSRTRPQTNNNSVINNATTAAVQTRLDRIANGTLKYNSSTVLKVGSRFTGTRSGEQCKGYAKNVFYLLFKVLPSSTQGKPYNYLLHARSGMTKVGSVTAMNSNNIKALFLKARPGDFVQIRRSHGGSHSAIVYSVTGSGVTFQEANLDGRNTIYRKSYTWSDLCSSNSAMSVYTASNYSLK